MSQSSTSAAAPAAPPKDVAVAAGRGVVFITAAKLYFIVAGYLVQFVLPRLLAGAAEYGVYAQVVAAVSILNNLLITGTIQAVSRFSAQDDARAPAVLRSALRVQLCVAVVVAGGYAAFAPWLADRFLRKPSLLPFLLISAVVVFCYAVYAAFVGSLNGRKLFRRQAAFDVTFSTLRTGLTLGLAAGGLGVLGAIGGFAAASVGILLVAAVAVGIGRPGPGVGVRAYLAFVVPIYGYHLLLNGILQVDVLFLSRAASLTAEHLGLAPAAAEEVANALAGKYRAAQSMAFIPYQLILSVAFVVFPLVSRAIFEKDLDATRAYIRGALRFSLLVCAGLASALAARPLGVLAFVFPPEYGDGADALAILAGGLVAFSLFVLVCTILNGAGRAGTSVALSALSLLGVVGLNAVLVPGRPGAEALTATAVATSAGMVLGLAAGAVVLLRTYGAFVPPLTGLRTAIAAGAVVAVGKALPETGRLGTLLVLTGLVVLFFTLLVALREVGAADLGKLRRIARGR